MAGVEDTYKTHLREEVLALARSLSQQITGGKGPDPFLLQMFALADKAGVISSDQLANTDYYRDLQALGADTTSGPFIHSPESELTVIKYDIIVLRDSIQKILASIDHLPNKKELNLLLQLDIPDPKARKIIIELLFTNGIHIQNLINFGEALNEINNTTESKEEVQANELLIRKKIRSIGETFAEVLAERERRGIKSKYTKEQEMSTLKPKRLARSRPANATEENNAYLQRRNETLPKYCRSSFCFCLVQLSQLPENLLWINDPRKFKIHIPPQIAKEMDKISSIATTFKFPDISKYLEGALRAYMRVYLGYCNDKALLDKYANDSLK